MGGQIIFYGPEDVCKRMAEVIGPGYQPEARVYRTYNRDEKEPYTWYVSVGFVMGVQRIALRALILKEFGHDINRMGKA